MANWGAKRGGALGKIALNVGATLEATGPIAQVFNGSASCRDGVCYAAVPNVVPGGTGAAEEVVQNARVLRGWAASKGRVQRGGSGPEVWGELDEAGKFTWRLKLKFEGSLRPGLEAGSAVPRFDARLGPGQYVNPFTGEVGRRSVGTHLPLNWPWLR